MQFINNCLGKTARLFSPILLYLLLLPTVSAVAGLHQSVAAASTVPAGQNTTGARRDVIDISFGIVPQQSASRLAHLWGPICARLSRQTGYRIQFRTAPDIPTFEKRLARGEYDIAYMNPYHYTVYHRQPGYRVFAKEKGKRLRGIVVVRKDSEVTNLRQLDRKTLAFPSPAAFAASILPRARFRSAGIRITPRYVRSHDSVYRAVARGLYPAGGGVVRTLHNADPGVKRQLRILWTTKPYTPHAIAAHPRVAANVVAKIRRAMVQMRRDRKGRALLESIKFTGIVPAADAEWDDIRALRVDLLPGNKTGSP